MSGDGVTTPIACEFVFINAEPDSGPHYCGFKPCECGFTSTTKCTAAGCSRPEPEVCATCGHGEHSTCDCRQYDIVAADFCRALEVAWHKAEDKFNNGESDPCTEDQHDRNAGRTCHACSNDLELNADFQCVRCGAHN